MSFAARRQGVGSVSDVLTMTAATGYVSATPVAGGYSDNTSGVVANFDTSFGSYSGTISGGRVLRDLCTLGSHWVTISGFSSNPGAGWLQSVTIGATTYAVSFNSYSGGIASWTITGFGGFGTSGSYSVTLTHQ